MVKCEEDDITPKPEGSVLFRIADRLSLNHT